MDAMDLQRARSGAAAASSAGQMPGDLPPSKLQRHGSASHASSLEQVCHSVVLSPWHRMTYHIPGNLTRGSSSTVALLVRQGHQICMCKRRCLKLSASTQSVPHPLHSMLRHAARDHTAQQCMAQRCRAPAAGGRTGCIPGIDMLTRGWQRVMVQVWSSAAAWCVCFACSWSTSGLHTRQ